MSQLSSDLRGDQLLPHSIESEEAVLGSILNNAEALSEVVIWLEPGDFYIVRHQWIYEAILTLKQQRKAIDYLTVLTELEQTRRLSEIGGASALLSLTYKTPSALNVEGYARTVDAMARRRRLIDAGSQVVRIAHSDETDIDQVVERSEIAFMEAIKLSSRGKSKRLGQLLSQHYDDTLYILDHKIEMIGKTSGLIDYDRKTGGYRDEDLIVIAARTSMGKTSYLLDTAAANAARGARVGFISYEMSEAALNARFITRMTGIPYQDVMDRHFVGDQMQEYMKAISDMDHWPIFIVDDVLNKSIAGCRSKARSMKLMDDIDLLIVDHIQEMTAPDAENRVLEIGMITSGLKSLARELHIPVIAACQLNRSLEHRSNKRPTLADLRESGKIEEIADNVTAIYRDAYYDPDTLEGNKAELIILKNRNGGTGTIDSIFDPDKMTFHNATRANIDLNYMIDNPPPPTHVALSATNGDNDD